MVWLRTSGGVVAAATCAQGRLSDRRNMWYAVRLSTYVIICALAVTLFSSPPVSGAGIDAKEATAYLEARRLEEAGTWKAAAATFEQVAGPKSDFADLALLGSGRCYRKRGNREQARSALERLLQDFPKSSAAPQARVELGVALAEMGLLKESVAQLEQALGIYPSSINKPEALYELGTVYQKMRNQDKALRTLERACRLAPDSKGALLSAKALAQTGGVLEGLEAVNVFLAQKRWSSAVGICERVLPATRSNTDLKARVLLGLARAYAGAGRLDDAVKTYATVADKCSGSSSAPHALLEAGTLKAKSGRRIEALGMWRRVREKYPAATEATEAQWEIARAFDKWGKAEQAVAEYVRFARAYPAAPLKTDALFRAGVLTYLQRDYLRAAELFLEAAQGATGRPAQDAFYWVGKSYRTGRKSHLAARYFSRSAMITPTGFYGYRAWAALHELSPVATRHENRVRLGKKWELVLPSTPRPLSGRSASVTLPQGLNRAASRLAARASFLLEHQLPEADWDLDELSFVAALSGPAALSQLFLYVGAYDRCTKVVESAIADADAPVRHADLIPYLYPLAYPQKVERLSSQHKLDSLLVTAVMREESHFNRMLVSSAGAVGLMQVMPETGRLVASRVGIQGYNDDSLFDRDTSLRLGAWYLRSLWKECDGNVVYVLAAYNAGLGNLRHWLRKSASQPDLDVFIETIPVEQTRNYIKKVLGAYGNYLQLK